MRRVVMAVVLGGLVLAGLTVRPASAAWQHWYGQNCGGIQVSRCAWLDYDRAAGLVRAGGNARDEINGGNYSVAVNDTMVQVLPFGGPWTTIKGTAVGDYDGWHPVWDASTSNAAGVWCRIPVPGPHLPSLDRGLQRRRVDRQQPSNLLLTWTLWAYGAGSCCR